MTSNIIRCIVLNAKQHTCAGKPGERYERSLFVKTDRERVRTYRKKKKGCDMVFNTGAALLDAIVLAVVSHERRKALTDIRSHRMCGSVIDMYPIPPCIRCFADDCRKISAWMVYDLECAMGATGDIIK